MTHEELLAKITGTLYTEKGYTISDGRNGNQQLQSALRAIVELHKPVEFEGEMICRECANLIDPWDENCYPCPTIELIEKALS